MDPVVVLLIVITAMVFIFNAAGLKIVKETQIGIVSRFGRCERTCDPGLHLIIPFVERIRRIDAHGTVLVRIDSPGHTGPVKIDNEEWRATTDEQPIPSGSAVRVIALKGDRLVVRPEV